MCHVENMDHGSRSLQHFSPYCNEPEISTYHWLDWNICVKCGNF